MTDWKAPFGEITAKTHSDQAVWWLNGFWPEDDEKAAQELGEQLWDLVEKFKEFEFGRPVVELKGRALERAKAEGKIYVEGSDLDEWQAHKLLEWAGETLSVKDMRKKLEAVDLDKNKRMALIEYLIFKNNKTPMEVVKAPQGDNKEKIDEAAAKLEEVQNALADVQQKLEEQKLALEEQKREEEAAAKALEEAKTARAAAVIADEKAQAALAEQQAAEALVRAAEAELQAAVDDLKAQEDAYAAKLADLEAKSNDESLGGVKRNSAKNQLAQLKAEDPLPLRKAKITQGAALKKVGKERKKAEKATAVAAGIAKEAEEAKAAAIQAEAESEVAAKKAEEARLESEEKTRQLDAAVADLTVKAEEMAKELQELKAQGGVAQGAIWWMEKKMKETQKFLKGRR